MMDANTDQSRRPNARLVTLLALVVLVVGLPLAYLQQREVTQSRTVNDRVEECRQLQGDSDAQQEPVVVCLADMLSDAVASKTYPQLLELSSMLSKSRLQASCHAAGHRVGSALYERYGAAGALKLMFESTERPVEYTCTTAVVHGVVGASEVKGEDMATVARYCLSLDAVDIRYTHECAHFYGHGVWREVGEISPRLTELCNNLDGSKTGMAVEICVSGSIMQRYDLQSKLYDPFNEEAKAKRPPERAELLTLCDSFAGNDVTNRGCMGAVGWLSAMRAQANLDISRDEDPTYASTAVEIYSAELAVCGTSSSCISNFLTHFRPAAYRNGIVTKVCEVMVVDMTSCDKVIALRTGAGNGQPMAPGSKDPSVPSSQEDAGS